MSDPTITPEQVMAAGCRRREAAERIAVYANRRAAGDRRIDAGRGLDVTPETLGSYEKWANVIRRDMGLPELPSPRTNLSVSRERYVEASISANHNRWHEGRGVTSPTCPHCPGGEP
jgi:hypothetical protein